MYEIKRHEENEGEKTDKLAELGEGNLRAVVVIPDDIDTNIGMGQPVDIRVYYDPAQTTSAQIILPVLKQAIDEVNRQITQQSIMLKLTEESIQAHDLRDIDYLVPGILAMSRRLPAIFISSVQAMPTTPSYLLIMLLTHEPPGRT